MKVMLRFIEGLIAENFFCVAEALILTFVLFNEQPKTVRLLEKLQARRRK